MKACALLQADYVTRRRWGVVESMSSPGGATPYAEADDSSFPFAASKLYPARADLAKGQCAEGIVPVRLKGEHGIKAVRYENNDGTIAWAL